jgi:hypothetical protein
VKFLTHMLNVVLGIILIRIEICHKDFHFDDSSSEAELAPKQLECNEGFAQSHAIPGRRMGCQNQSPSGNILLCSGYRQWHDMMGMKGPVQRGERPFVVICRTIDIICKNSTNGMAQLIGKIIAWHRTAIMNHRVMLQDTNRSQLDHPCRHLPSIGSHGRDGG